MPLRDHMDDTIPAVDILGDHERWEVAITEHGPLLEWTEQTHFHRERFPEMFDEEGWPKDGVSEALEAALREHTGRDDITVDEDHSGTDEPGFVVVVPVDGLTMDSEVSDLGEKVWPSVAMLTNVTDPGTFGSPYILSMTRERWQPTHYCQYCRYYGTDQITGEVDHSHDFLGSPREIAKHAEQHPLGDPEEYARPIEKESTDG